MINDDDDDVVEYTIDAFHAGNVSFIISWTGNIYKMFT